MVAEPRGNRHQGSRQSAHAGSWFAWLGGYRATHTDKLSHANVKIPVAKTARLKFYVYSDTEDPIATPGDKLTVQLSYGTTTRTLATYYDVQATFTYDLKVLDLTPYVGKTVTLKFIVTTNNDTYASSWLVDDVAVKYTTT